MGADTHLYLLLQIFVEYVMLAGVNDSAEQAHQLGRLLQGRDLVINLIPWNPVYSPDFSYEVTNWTSSAEPAATTMICLLSGSLD